MATMNQSPPAYLASMDVPHTQNTAPVLEFRCLFTADLRRKQKRWQDGRLKFHTFNRRVMVYDERSNFVGDTHWRKDYEFEEGEELELERGGILIEVGECVGKRDQDLTELVEKRVKDREDRVASKIAITPRRPQPSLVQTPAGSGLLRPKSLNAVLGNPSGHYGKAVMPTLSPFEQRQRTNRDEIGRPAKRRKQGDTPPSKNGYAQSLLGTTLSLTSARPPSTASICYEPFKSSIQRPPVATIDLTEDNDQGPPDETDERPQDRRKEKTANKSRQKFQRSPPTRSGYASNLTGASLNLKNPESLIPKRSYSGLELPTKRCQPAEGTRSSSPVQVDSSQEDAFLAEKPTQRAEKRKVPVKKRRKPSAPEPAVTSRSSSPPDISRSSLSLRSKTTDRPTQDAFASRHVDRPVSALRIKSRPRKMMMLMDRSITRSPVQDSAKNTQPAPRRNRAAKPSKEQIALSQATLRLDAFREQQEQRLQDRLNNARLSSEPEAAEDHSSSLADCGIDHVTIDNLLSQTASQSKEPPSTVSKPLDFSFSDHMVNGKEEVETIKPTTTPRIAEDAARTNGMDPSILSSSGYEPLDIMEPIEQLQLNLQLPHKFNFSCSDALSSISGSPLNLVSPKPQKEHTPKTPQSSSFPSTDALIDIGSKSPGGLDLEEPSTTKANEKATPSDSLPSVNQSNQKDRAGEKETPAPPLTYTRSAQSATSVEEDQGTSGSHTMPQANPPTTHATTVTFDVPTPLIGLQSKETAIFATPLIREADSPISNDRSKASSTDEDAIILPDTEHFRSLIKTSASFPINVAQRTHARLQTASTTDHELLAQNHSLASSKTMTKTCPKTSSELPEGKENKDRSKEVMNSTVIVANQSELATTEMDNTKLGPPRTKLINPATRGPSVQTTANKTSIAVAPAFNAIPSMPPPARSVARPGRIVAREETRVEGPAKEVTPGGPWSRESFDLFGQWRPSGRKIAGAGSTNA